MHPPNTRWVQGFSNFERRFLLLRDVLQCRRLIAESYNETTAIALEQAIRRRYYGLLQALYQTLKAKTEGSDNS